jgi:putative ABC transport system permease protein
MANDLRYAIRVLLRSPSFTLTATLTLALGIGATTAIFSVVNAVLLEPLPYRQPDRLVITRLSLPDYRDVQRISRSFEQSAVWASNQYTLQTGDESRQVLGGVVSRDLMPLLGVTPVLGRNFTVEDDRQKTVILGYGLWQSLYGGDPAAIGRALDLSGTPYTVIGIAPRGFSFPNQYQLWTPLGLVETDAKPQAENRGLRIFTALSRLRPEVTLEQARGELTTISAELARTYPTTNAEITLEVLPLRDRIVGNVRTSLLVLLATVALLLLIACANVANLMLARTSAREREMAIRSALGAGRLRIFRQLAIESLVLAAAGGACGLLLAFWTVDFLPTVLDARLPRADAIRIDGTVLLAALAATVLTGVVFGTAASVQTRESATALKEGGRGLTVSSRSRTLRRTIVVAEIAFSALVVVGAALLVRSFLTLTSRDPGFTPQNLLSFNVQFMKIPDVPSRGRTGSALMERLAQLPGVQAAGAATGLPTVTPQRGTRFDIEGRQLTSEESGAYFIAATPGYFRAAGIPILSGRAIESDDSAGRQPVVVVNRTLANRLFPGQNPVGRRMRVVNPEYSGEWRTIVGVVGDVPYRGLDSEIQPTIYASFEQTPFPWLYVMVRTSGDSPALARSIRTVVKDLDARLSSAEVRPMTEIVSGTVAEPRFSMLLVSGFAVLALALAAIGIYGVIAYSVTQRTHEIGVRMALGAARSSVLGMIVREGLLMAVLGIVAGLVGAALATRLMTTLLVGITPRDPIAFGAGATLLLLVAGVASYVPARRATRVDPVVALRAE